MTDKTRNPPGKNFLLFCYKLKFESFSKAVIILTTIYFIIFFGVCLFETIFMFLTVKVHLGYELFFILGALLNFLLALFGVILLCNSSWKDHIEILHYLSMLNCIITFLNMVSIILIFVLTLFLVVIKLEYSDSGGFCSYSSIMIHEWILFPFLALLSIWVLVENIVLVNLIFDKIIYLDKEKNKKYEFKKIPKKTSMDEFKDNSSDGVIVDMGHFNNPNNSNLLSSEKSLTSNNSSSSFDDYLNLKRRNFEDIESKSAVISKKKKINKVTAKWKSNKS